MLSRTAINAFRRAAPKASIPLRGFAASAVTHKSKNTTNAATPAPAEINLSAIDPCLKPLSEIKSPDDLLPPGAPPGTVPTDYNQSTGLERLEILGKIQGVDIFDMRPLDASRLGTVADPIVVGSYGEERYLGCTGFPSDSHNVIWLTTSRTRPLERCPECGSVYRMEFLGKVPEEHGHGQHEHAEGEEEHHHHGYVEPKTFADFVRPEYTGR